MLVRSALVCVGGVGGDIVLSNGERRWSLHAEPVLAGKWVGSLLEALLALGQSLVLSYSHICDGCDVKEKVVLWLVVRRWQFDGSLWSQRQFELCREKLGCCLRQER